ncbi:DEAD/DEAH box helicase [Flavisolibacter tropicus]|uniref:DNA helicase n=1 Tax=Flavisolibacter tropicus TaxID=1492898 RepID=A0A172U104_9BACT|nr:DEAD/DEAH box helicase [Flavisolibacter tropicus]ANE53000.1 DNA helicase [Flavisolibacter tropicus]
MYNSITEVKELLLLNKQQVPSILGTAMVDGALIVVFRQYRFHKQLSIELYQASFTQAGKVKNPLVLVSPLDQIWKREDAKELKFFSAISRFQNHPTMVRSAADLDALKAVMENPLSLRCFYHNTEFSENIVAGSLKVVVIGDTINNATLWVNKTASDYTLHLQLTVNEEQLEWKDVEVKYDYFIIHNEQLHLLGNLTLLNLVQFFKPYRNGMTIPASQFATFQKEVLAKLEDKVTVTYTYIQAATDEQQLESDIHGAIEKYIYLSDLEPYVIINPVVRYGQVDIPVLSKRQIYITSTNGEQLLVQRNEESEAKFTALLIRQHPALWDQLEHDLPYFYLNREQFLNENWFLQAFEEWKQHGITILGFNQLKRNNLNSNKATITIKVISGLNWFNTEVDVRFGKNKARLKQLQQAVRNKSKFVRLDDGTLGILPQEWLDRLTAYLNAGQIHEEQIQTPKIAFASISELYENQMLTQEVQNELELYAVKLKEPATINDVDVPGCLHATLRPYQLEGLRWLNFLDDHNFGGCLADDMGLGKSIQIIAFILLQRQKVARNINLLVVPTSLLFNWQVELEKFAPSIKVYTLYGANRSVNHKRFEDCEVVLTSYGTLLSDVVLLRKFTFNYIFLDESQNIKNVESQRYQAVSLLQSRNKIVITGTPIENNTFDLYSQLSFACPGLLGNKQYFRDTYAIPIDRFKESKRAQELQRKVAPFILRRTKQQVAADLPEKTEVELYCPMDAEQRNIYEAYEKEFREFISAQDGDEIKKNSMHVLRGLTRLRQICNSPLLLGEEKLNSDGSSKIETLVEQIETKAPQHKILVFSQFVSMLNLVRKELLARGIGFEYLTGSTKDRQAVVENFQKNEDVRVFLISLKAGGVGLNLTAADYVYLVDPWWNPAVENQAIDRTYRIGQHKNVMAIRLICPDTIEEKIQKLQATKKEMTAEVIKSDEGFLQSLSKTDLLYLLNTAKE